MDSLAWTRMKTECIHVLVIDLVRVKPISRLLAAGVYFVNCQTRFVFLRVMLTEKIHELDLRRNFMHVCIGKIVIDVLHSCLVSVTRILQHNYS
jgi:hypothetical protein